MNGLKGKVAVITGGNRGIGKSIAMALASEECRIAISGRDERLLSRAEEEIRNRYSTDIVALTADVRSPADATNLARRVEQELGPANILVNNAGIGIFSDVVQMHDEDFRAVLETNLFGVFYVTKALLPGMIEHGGGHVVNIGSLAGKNNFAGGSAYCASKHALISFGECLMLEVRHQNVKVTTICPGSVQTDFSADSRAKDWALTGDDVAQSVVDVLKTSPGSLISLVDLRPLKPRKR